MTLDDYVNTFGRHMKQRYGERVQKVALNAGLTCPNIDGSLGRGGCTFCDNRAFSPFARKPPPVLAQLEAGRQVARQTNGATLYIGYFQAYTNTYGQLGWLESLWRQVLSQPDVVGISIGTRPDCVPDSVLDLLCTLTDEGYDVWLELGLQSAFDETLAAVNRGHGWSAYEDATNRARARGIPVCTHLILGLPGESQQHWRETFHRVMQLGTEGIKLHPLHVVCNTRLAQQWRRGLYQPLDAPTYMDAVATLVQQAPDNIIFHRLTATAPARVLLAPDWCRSRWPIINGITERLRERSTYGTGLSRG